MHEVLQALHEDHVNLSRLLRLVQHELDRAAQGDDIDYRTVLDVLDYIEHYADKVHHPHENTLYARLSRFHPDRTAMVDGLADEHRRLSEATHNAAQLLSAALGDVIVDKQKVNASVADYVSEQFEHMSMEERDVFPLIDTLFQPDDWRWVSEQFEGTDDPLFGVQTKARYRALYEALSAAEQ